MSVEKEKIELSVYGVAEIVKWCMQNHLYICK